MNANKTLIWVLMAVLLFAFCFAFVGDAAAQGKKPSFTERKGIEGLLSGAPDSDPTKGPKGWQKAVGLGSIFVMIAVVKWL